MQFADGVYLVLLMGLLEGYFVPLFNFFLTPEHFDQKVGYNVNRTHFNLLQIVYSELLTGLAWLMLVSFPI
jgi:parvin